MLAAVACSRRASPVRTAAAPVAVARPASIARRSPSAIRFRYTVEVSRRRGDRAHHPACSSGQLGDFTITDFGDAPPRKENGRVDRHALVHAHQLHHRRSPRPGAEGALPHAGRGSAGGRRATRCWSASPACSPRSRTRADIRDIKPPEEVPFDWRPYGIAAGAVVVVGAARRRVLLPAQPPARGSAGSRRARRTRSRSTALNRFAHAASHRARQVRGVLRRALGDRARATWRTASTCARRR